MGSTHSIPTANSILTAIIVVGCITFSWIIFAPMVISIYRKIRKGSTILENFSEFPFPYLASFMNCMMGLIYRLPNVHPHNTVLLIINGVGIFVEGIYISLAFKSSTGLKRVTIALVFVITLVLIGAFSAVIFVGVPTPDKRIKIVGPMCVFFGILIYGSTIPALIRAWTTKKVESVSWFLTVTGLANTIFWLVYGSIKKDKYMKIQNGCGLVLCFIQLIFYRKINAAATDLPVSIPVAAELPCEVEL